MTEPKIVVTVKPRLPDIEFFLSQSDLDAIAEKTRQEGRSLSAHLEELLQWDADTYGDPQGLVNYVRRVRAHAVELERMLEILRKKELDRQRAAEGGPVTNVDERRRAWLNGLREEPERPCWHDDACKEQLITDGLIDPITPDPSKERIR